MTNFGASGTSSKDGLRYFKTAPKHAMLVKPNAIAFVVEKSLLDHCCAYSNGAVVRELVQTHAVDANRTIDGGTLTSTSFWASFRALLSSTAPHTRRLLCSTSCPC